MKKIKGIILYQKETSEFIISHLKMLEIHKNIFRKV